MNKKSRYVDEELEILQALEADALKPATDADQRTLVHRVAATATFKKDQRMDIRISSRDLKSLQARALEEGVPYQSLAASLLHKYVSGLLVNHQ